MIYILIAMGTSNKSPYFKEKHHLFTRLKVFSISKNGAKIFVSKEELISYTAINFYVQFCSEKPFHVKITALKIIRSVLV